MGCFCCFLASFWQIVVFIHSATCTVPRLASAGLFWEIQFLPLERGRGFLERAKQLGQGDISLLDFNKAGRKKVGHFIPRETGCTANVVLHAVSWTGPGSLPQGTVMF